MQVQDQSPPSMWSQAALQKMPPPVGVKPQQQYFLPPPAQSQLSGMDKKMKLQELYWDSAYRLGKRAPPAGGFCQDQDLPARSQRGAPFEDSRSPPLLPPELDEERLYPKAPDFYQAAAAGSNLFQLPNQTRMDTSADVISQSSLLPLSGFPIQENYQNNSMFSQAYGNSLAPGAKPDAPMMHQEPSLYSLFEGTPWSPSLPASSDQSTPASQSPHSSNPSSLPSSPPTHTHASVPFSNFGPIGTPDSRDRRLADRWKADKTCAGGFGLDYLPAASSAASESSWHQSGPAGASWTSQDSPMEENSSTVLLDSLKSIWSSSMMQPGPSALEQLLMQQKQKQQRNPPH